ncbi:type I DNA topoisomerase, partial [candidate division KSB1 bacterium]|nr:type I DNA topoisomerase [candidate division KSB1 bacterium]
PAKAKTLQKYLGNNFEILASYGHVRDLIPKKGAVNTDDFSMHYELIPRNKKYVDAIIKSAKNNDALYLATDPDREGEAISWHICELLKEKKSLSDKPIYRVEFHEITKGAVKNAIDHPRKLSTDLVNAQQARRALDYLVGFNLSPLLWKKIKRGLSAGRVQSPALRMICEREKEIAAFDAKEYWTIEADLKKEKQIFDAKLFEWQGKKLQQFDINNEKNAKTAREKLIQLANGSLKVAKIEKKKQKRYPSPPFTTSLLQQEAARKLGFRPIRTMRIAQQLYEGVQIGPELVGLITYMRTDSFTLANEALSEIRNQIKNLFGPDQLPPKPIFYKTKSKNAQEAHEAIRPTSVLRQPFEIEKYLTEDQFKIYSLIWKRTMACQMAPAIVDLVSADLSCGSGNIFRATGSHLAEPGFYRVYHEIDEDAKIEIEEKTLPPLKEGENVDLLEIRPEQHFTKPPPRYTEASLVKSLEAYGIGRPSTYAQIINTLLEREYVELEQRRFSATDIGKIVNDFLTKHFEHYVDYEFTARLEDDLDAVSRGEREWKPLMREFWDEFNKQVEEKNNVPREEVIQARELGVDPASGRPVSVRYGRFGPLVQIGTRDDEEKPLFASLQPGQSIDSITFAEAMELFKLPRRLGETEDGEPVLANIGRYGPYVQYGRKFVSLKEDDPHTITLERALEVIAEKKEADANKVIKTYPGSDIQVLNGRYGPYITDGKKNARIPKGKEPAELTLDECRDLIEKAPAKGKRKFRRKSK